MRTEREPNRYEPLKETHRRAAEEEEKRRLAEQEQTRSASAQPQPEPLRPGTELRPSRPEITPDDPYAPEARLAEMERGLREQVREPSPSRPTTKPEHDPDSPEARLAVMEQELQDRVRLGRINSSEMIYQLRQFDNELRVEIETGRSVRSEFGAAPAGPQPEAERGATQPVEQTAQEREEQRQLTEPSRDGATERASDRQIEREAAAAEFEITRGGEMTAARAARLARLQNIDRSIERENRENEGKGPELDHGSGDHSR